jgi:hypothetical protein
VILGCDANGTVLITSADDGQSWRPVATLPADAYEIQYIGMQVIMYRTSAQPASLMVSSDGGSSFRQAFPPLP